MVEEIGIAEPHHYRCSQAKLLKAIQLFKLTQSVFQLLNEKENT